MEVNPNQWDNTKGHLKDRIVIDKDWVETTLDKFYNPDKYKTPEKNKNLEVVPMYEYYLEMHPLSEVRQRNNRVIIRALRRYEKYIRKTKRGKKEFVLMLNEVTPDILHSIWNYFKQEHTLVENKLYCQRHSRKV